MQIVIYIAIFLVSAIIFTFVGMAIRKKVAESKLGSAEEEARKIINLAQKEAENKKKEEIYNEGEQSGVQKGIQKGELKKARETVFALLEMGMPVEQITKAVKIPLTTVQSWIAETKF